VEMLQQWGGWPVLNSDWTPLDWHRMGDIVAEFAVPFIFSISSLASLDNANTTAVYVSYDSLYWRERIDAVRYNRGLVKLLTHHSGRLY
jgi:hypothetical protein